MVAPLPIAVAKPLRKTSTPHPWAASSCIVRKRRLHCEIPGAISYDRGGNATPARRQSVHVCRCRISCVTDDNRYIICWLLSVTCRRGRGGFLAVMALRHGWFKKHALRHCCVNDSKAMSQALRASGSRGLFADVRLWERSICLRRQRYRFAKPAKFCPAAALPPPRSGHVKVVSWAKQSWGGADEFRATIQVRTPLGH